MQFDSSSTISSVPSDKLKHLEQEVLLPTGPQSSKSLPKLDNISDILTQVTSVLGSKNQVERMSEISGKTPSLFSGLSQLEDPTPLEIEGIFDSSVSTTSASKRQVGRMSVISGESPSTFFGLNEEVEKEGTFNSSVYTPSATNTQTVR
jgi:hypothetical protein